MKNKRLEKIAKGVAHPFLSIIPNQEYLCKKLEWYNPVVGILESSFLEVALPILYVSTNPSSIGLIIGTGIALDGMWRINKLMDGPPPSENPSKKDLG
ncbi:MAG: hypothetical protein NTZ83_02035, partial [Candidatus Pacearchaeota archaeon]|nr:hypothetical protein [Candidatus Pacearchaeota archaeon]